MIKGKTVCAITLARAGSKRIKNKNFKELNCKPLIKYTTDEVKKSKIIDTYIVSSDSNKILDLCKNENIETFKRGKAHASDTATSADALIEVIMSKNLKFDYIVEIMCTNPLKTVSDIDNTISKLYHSDADSVVSVSRVWDSHPSRIKYIEDDVLKDFFPEISESRRQDLVPHAYIRNGSIYATTTVSLLKTKNRLSGIIRPYIMNDKNSINIDEDIDFKLAELILTERNKND
jgi:CMP-N,N'-diacetyllegionaminic acid synthase